MRKERELWEKSDDIVHTLDMRHRTGQDRTGSDTMGSRVSFGDSRPQSITEGGGERPNLSLGNQRVHVS